MRYNSIKYNIHNLINIKINKYIEVNAFNKILNPLDYFRTSNENKHYDIILNICNFTPKNENSYFLDHKYYIKENYIYAEDNINMLNWKVEINGFEKDTTIINFWSNFLGLRYFINNYLPQEMFLFPLIVYKLFLIKNSYLIHSSGVSKNGKAHIFMGLEGHKKTEITINYLKKGFNYVGDDWVILTNKGVYSFPKNFYSFLYSYTNNNIITEKYSIFNKLDFILNSNFNFENLVKIEDVTRSYKLYILNKSDKNINKIIKNESHNIVANKIMLNNKFEFYK